MKNSAESNEIFGELIGGTIDFIAGELAGKAIENESDEVDSGNELIASLIGGTIDYVATKMTGKAIENDEENEMFAGLHYPIKVTPEYIPDHLVNEVADNARHPVHSPLESHFAHGIEHIILDLEEEDNSSSSPHKVGLELDYQLNGNLLNFLH